MTNTFLLTNPTRVVFGALGWCAVVLAAAGIVVPGLPTTVFVLAASYCFSKSSPRFADWLRRHPWFGPSLERFLTDGGMPRSTKRHALWAMWTGVLMSSVVLSSVHPMAALTSLGLGALGTLSIVFAVRTVPERASMRSLKRMPTSARDAIEALERDAPLLDGAGDRFAGYAIIGLPFQSGHVLALRRFSASSIGPGYTSVWHRDPSGRWTFYSTVRPDLSCARYFGGQVERNVVAPIEITWVDSTHFCVVVGATIQWHVILGTSLTTQLLNTVAGLIPERAWQMPAILRLIGTVAKATLGTGRLNLTGLTPNGHRFIANPRRLWLIESSVAAVDGVSLGPPGPLASPASLGDLLLPQRGLFAVTRARLEQPVNRRAGARAVQSRARAWGDCGSALGPEHSTNALRLASRNVGECASKYCHDGVTVATAPASPRSTVNSNPD